MNEEYLWNKTGEDAGIERLEELLSDFSYVPTAAPEIRKVRSRSVVWQIVPLLGAAVIAIVAVFALTRVRRPEIIAVSDAPLPSIEQNFTTPVTNDPPAATKRVTSEKPRFVKTIYRQTASPKRRPSVVGRETLTAEEKHAYQQVLLALYITGSQLKTVNDAIDGIENKHSGK
jgi:hypothetical protein